MNFILTPLKFVIGLVGATLLFWVGVAYVVYVPAGWPNYKVALWTIHLPWAGEVQAERAKAQWNAAQWAQCKANEATLQSAIASQNASIAALADAGSRAKAEASRAVQQAQGAMARASEVRGVIAAPVPATDTVCQAAELVDQRFVGTLK